MLGFVLLQAAATPIAADEPSPEVTLWYRRPAAAWIEALPVGNGRLGAMVFGGTQQERLQLNEATVWTGGPYDPNQPAGHLSLPEIRRLVFAGRLAEAEALFERTMMARVWDQAKYQPLGDLRLTLPEHALPRDYRRELDLDTAIATTRYRIGEAAIRREVFVSAVDDVDRRPPHGRPPRRADADGHARRPGQPEGRGRRGLRDPRRAPGRGRPARADRPLRRTRRSGSATRRACEARVEDGTVALDFEREHAELRIEGATSVTLLVAAATSFRSYQDTSGDPAAAATAALAAAMARPFERLRADHVAAHRKLFRRVRLELGAPPRGAPASESRRPTSASPRSPRERTPGSRPSTSSSGATC